MVENCCNTCFQCETGCGASDFKSERIKKDEVCSDTPADDNFTCEEQKEFRKCSESWMVGKCCSTCFGCEIGCRAIMVIQVGIRHNIVKEAIICSDIPLPMIISTARRNKKSLESARSHGRLDIVVTYVAGNRCSNPRINHEAGILSFGYVVCILINIHICRYLYRIDVLVYIY